MDNGMANKPKPQICISLVFLNVRDTTHAAQQYGKDWVPFGLPGGLLVSALGLLFTIDLIHYAFSKLENVSNLL